MLDADDASNRSATRPASSMSGADPIRVTALSSDGAGIARLPDGRVVFVEGGVPGDLIEMTDIEIRKRMARARIGRLLEPGPDRIEPRCRHVDRCGGCTWQNLDYAAQLEAKRTSVRDALTRIGGFEIEAEIEIVASPSPYGYRARARLVESGGQLGYRRRGSHEIEAIEECPVLVPSAHEATMQLVESAAERCGAVDVASSRPAREKKREWVVTAGSTGPALVHEITRRGRRAPRGFIDVDVLGESLRASSTSFIQGNQLMWDVLGETVRTACLVDAGRGTPIRFIELHAGIGFLTLPLARAGLSGVAIESDRSAFEDLVANLKRAGLSDAIETLRGRVETRGDWVQRMTRADLLLMDPPRIGLPAKVRDSIAAEGPARIVYVSCDPATLARDLRVLRTGGYELASIRALDLFPQTPHVEVVVRLEREST